MSEFEKILRESLAKSSESIREHTDNLKLQASLLNRLGYISSDELYQDLVIACEYHDYGKANSEFQQRIKNRKKFNPQKEIPHNVLSLYYVDESLCYDYVSVCFSVLYHHYHSVSPIDVLIDNKEEIEKNLLEFENETEVKKRLTKVKRMRTKFNRILQQPIADKQYLILLKGLLHKCDYSASAGIDCELPNNFLDEIMNEWQKDKQLKKLQVFCIEHQNDDIIATAPTGMGKTEAGLMWCGNHKCFFVLPLRTAINAMYERLKKLTGADYKNRVALLHSDMQTYYLLDQQNKNQEQEVQTDFDYINRTRQLAMPITICTPDQIFDFVMKYAGYEYKLAAASYSKFIIDEIQMYDAELLAAIMYGIKMIKAVGGKVAVLTATLPPFVNEELENILGKNCACADFSSYGQNRHNMNVFEKPMQSEDVISVIDRTQSDSVKKFLVVCNSIDTANLIFEQLCQYYDETEIKVNLFHARFTKNDRRDKEMSILKSSYDRTSTEIWVSTSVVEASLDIDFDILFTELSDLFSLFQRFGRVNRQGEKPIDKTNCYVYTELQGNAKKYHFYDKDIYGLSKKAIIDFGGGIIDEVSKHSLIQEYMSSENIRHTQFFVDYQKQLTAYEELCEYVYDKRRVNLRNIFSYDVIPITVYESNKQEIESAKTLLLSKSVLSEEEKQGLTSEQINQRTAQKRLEARNIINGFTVSVSSYRAGRKNLNPELSNESAGILVINNCIYDFNTGLQFTEIIDNGEIQNASLFL